MTLVHAKCAACGNWRRPSEILDVRSYPETAERPILDRKNREIFEGPLMTVIDNESSTRDPLTGEVTNEVTKQVRKTYSRPSIVGYETVDLKRGAGFVCSGCWTRWIRERFEIGGQVYTRLRHITMLGAPQDVITEYAGRPGVDTPGLGLV